MATPFSHIDSINFSVTPISVLASGTAPRSSLIGRATGFFFTDGERTFLITNRHVCIREKENYYPDIFRILVHVDKNSLRRVRQIIIQLYDEDRRPVWLRHPHLRNSDVIAINVSNYLNEGDIIQPFSERNFVSRQYYLELGTELLIVGYPLGFYDELYNMPVVRSGTLASQYGVGFRGEPFFLIDANIHKGTSGSPVVITRTAFSKTEYTGSTFAFVLQTLLGVLSGRYSMKGIDLGLGIVWFPVVITDIISSQMRGRIIHIDQ